MSSTAKLFIRAGTSVRACTTSNVFAKSEVSRYNNTSNISSNFCYRALPCPYHQFRYNDQHRNGTFESTQRRRQKKQLSHQQTRSLTTTNSLSQTSKIRTPAHQRDAKLASSDRGPKSSEETVTDFGALNVLGQTPNPSTSVDICAFDGFMLDSGLRIGDGDGVVLLGKEAFVWRPWMAGDKVEATNSVITGNMLRKAAGKRAPIPVQTGGLVNAKGQWEIPDTAWAILDVVAPKPDLLIIGTGSTIRPLAPATRNHLQELGMRIEVLDTRNAASQFNLLATERGVEEIAAVLVPIGFGSG